ncbi:Lgr3, partial [Drosophila busckii]
ALKRTRTRPTVSLTNYFVYIIQGPCPRGSFACNNGQQCVSQRQMCDKHPDCDDGSDEHPVECGNLHGSKELFDKIVRNAIEKRQRLALVGSNGTAGELATPAGHRNQIMAMPCDIVTYPRSCQCGQGTILYCGKYARLRRWPRISAEVTYLIFIRNNMTLRENAFANFTRLQKLTLKFNNISRVPLGSFNGLPLLERLELSYNNVSQLPTGSFKDLHAVQWLFLGNNQLRQLAMENLAGMQRLEWLVLSHNRLTLHNEQLPEIPALREIDLQHNRITHIHKAAFANLTAIADIRLIGNPIKELSGKMFLYNKHLDALSLAQMPLTVNAELLQHLNVSFLNLSGIHYDYIDFTALNEMPSLKYLIFDGFFYCSMVPRVLMCKPKTDGVSSFKDLLSKPALRYSTWFMATLSIVGNLMVLWGRFIYRDENVAVTMVIRNLALADILMGFYLVAIGVQDFRYRNEYHKMAREWTNSWQCLAIGTLAVSSSEVSMLILAFMSLERFLLIADPFRSHRSISVRIIFFALLCIWLTGVGLAVTPVLLLWKTGISGLHSGICFPLHIHEAFPLGWEYSAFVFLGVNLLLLLMIALLYTALLISIWRTRSATPLSLLDCEFAVRFFFIVLTDVMCWAPVIAMKIWVFFNYNVSDDMYAWLVVFILPLNSAVNPVLYTFTTPKYRNQIVLRGWKNITSRNWRGNVANTTGTTATGSSQQPEDSTTITGMKTTALTLTLSL